MCLIHSRLQNAEFKSILAVGQGREEGLSGEATARVGDKQVRLRFPGAPGVYMGRRVVSKCYGFGVRDANSGWMLGADMGIMEREGHVTDVGCITPGVRKGKTFQSNGEVVR